MSARIKKWLMHAAEAGGLKILRTPLVVEMFVVDALLFMDK